jgi:RNA 3'-terminal phosphate cyclase (ATP)
MNQRTHRDAVNEPEHMISLDGSQGEGGGQILRSSLALSLLSGRPFELRNIRAKRTPPGLRPQHLLAVGAAQKIGQARVSGDRVGSRRLVFEPVSVQPGEYEFPLETAGSTSLIAQTVLPALIHAHEPSRVAIQGGTHNPFCPPFDFFDESFLESVQAIGWRVTRHLVRCGFYPKGGGRIELDIEPLVNPKPLDLMERGPLREASAQIHLSRLPDNVAERESAELRRLLDWDEDQVSVITHPSSMGPLNVIVARLVFENVSEIFIAHGEKGKPASDVAGELAREMLSYLKRDWPVGEYLADQLLLPMVLSAGGHFRTGPLSSHTTTNIDTIRAFLPDVVVDAKKQDDRSVIVSVSATGLLESNGAET